MSCDPEKVTGFVDGELDAASLVEMAAHVEACPACRAQAEAERELRARLRGLPVPGLPAGFEASLRSRVRRRPVAVTAARWALPLAATLVFGLWLRGHAPFVAWDLARDHDKCFSRRPLPAKVWSGDPAVVSGWFEAKGTAVPALPAEVGALRLQGARYCPLASLALAPHVYYAAEDRHVSVFVVPQDVRIGLRFAGQARGDAVRLLRVEGELVGIVGERDADVQAVESALRPVMAALLAAHP
ncbi:MAG TPA: zf-HC2 domain-containing protein [Vicinamibacteria bacterium]